MAGETLDEGMEGRHRVGAGAGVHKAHDAACASRVMVHWIVQVFQSAAAFSGPGAAASFLLLPRPPAARTLPP